tara:strand:+ start:900 stop:1895 length:996 start_codon:yes stop_codon:yes gene_type:complete
MPDNKLLKDAILSYLHNKKINLKKFKINIIKKNKSKNTALAKVIISTKKNRTLTIYLKKYSSIENAQREFEILKKISISKNNKGIEPLRGEYLYNKMIIFRELKGNQLIDILNEENQIVLEDMFKNLGKWLFDFHNLDLNFKQDILNFKSSISFKNFLEHEYEYYINNFSQKFLNEQTIKNSKKIFSFLLSKVESEPIYVTCHGDFCFQNLIINKHENRINVIDFEECSSNYQCNDISFFCAKLKLLQLFYPKKTKILDNLEYNFLRGYQKKFNINQNHFEILKFVYLHRINSPLLFKFFLDPSNLRVLISRKRYADLISKEITRLEGVNI